MFGKKKQADNNMNMPYNNYYNGNYMGNMQMGDPYFMMAREQGKQEAYQEMMYNQQMMQNQMQMQQPEKKKFFSREQKNASTLGIVALICALFGFIYFYASVFAIAVAIVDLFASTGKRKGAALFAIFLALIRISMQYIVVLGLVLVILVMIILILRNIKNWGDKE